MSTDKESVFDVITIGSATVDFFADTDSELINIQTRTTTEELIAFPLGSKLLIEKLNITSGGGGTNTAVAFSRLGFKTGYIGKVGEDTNGDLVINNLSTENIEFLGAREGQTGISFILNSIKQDRTILAYKGANNLLRPNELKSFQSTWIFLASMLDESFETIVELLQHQPCRLAFNPSNYQAELGYEKLASLIKHVEILIMNKEEATKFLGLPTEGNHSTLSLMMKMAELPPRVFVITDGQYGVTVFDSQQLYHAQPREGFEVVETTGAGDAFSSTFTAAQMLGKTTEECIHLAMTNAESVLQYHGAKEKLLSRDELLETAAGVTRTIQRINV